MRLQFKRHILLLILGAFVCTSVGAWLFFLRTSHATAVIMVDFHDYTHNIIELDGPSVGGYIAMLKTQKLKDRVQESYSPSELSELRNQQWGQDRTPNFGSIAPSWRQGEKAEEYYIDVISSHPSRVAAVLIANKFASEFLEFMDESFRESRREALDYLYARKHLIAEQRTRAEANLEDAREQKSPKGIQSATDKLTIAQSLFQQISERVDITEKASFEPSLKIIRTAALTISSAPDRSP